MAPQTSTPVELAVERLAGEKTISTLLHAAAQELVGLLDARRCAISRAVGDLLVEVTAFQTSGTSPQLDLYLASDFPLTQDVLELGEPSIVSVEAPDADPAEVALLGRLGFTDLLMLPLSSRGKRWGLVEVYATDRSFGPAEIELGQELLAGAEAMLSALERG